MQLVRESEVVAMLAASGWGAKLDWLFWAVGTIGPLWFTALAGEN